MEGKLIEESGNDEKEKNKENRSDTTNAECNVYMVDVCVCSYMCIYTVSIYT